MAATDVLTEIRRLPAEQRAKLAWDDELERRAAGVEAGIVETMCLDEYRAHVRARRAARAPR
jgi:hypothetical protein